MPSSSTTSWHRSRSQRIGRSTYPTRRSEDPWHALAPGCSGTIAEHASTLTHLVDDREEAPLSRPTSDAPLRDEAARPARGARSRASHSIAPPSAGTSPAGTSTVAASFGRRAGFRHASRPPGVRPSLSPQTVPAPRSSAARRRRPSGISGAPPPGVRGRAPRPGLGGPGCSMRSCTRAA